MISKQPSALALVGLVAVAASFFASPAIAQNVSTSTKACTQAARRGQLLRDESKLVEARAAFVECAQPSCPKVVTKDCSQWQADVDQRTPTIVVAARDSGGERLVDVTVRVDGKPFATKLDGRSLPINPGKHNIAFEANGYATVEQEIIVDEGVRARVVEVQMESTTPPAKTDKPNIVSPPYETPRGGPGPAPWIFAGIGVVGLGAFAGLALSVNGDYSDLDSKCKPNCTDEQVDPLRTRATISYVALGVGAAAAITSVILFTTASRSGSGSVSLRARPGLSFAGLELAGTL